MKFRAAVLIAVLGATAVTAQTPTPAATTAPESFWTKGFGQGIAEYQTGTFDRPVDGGLRFACLPNGGATMTVQIKGVAPAAGSRFLLIPATRAGRSQSFTFTAGPDGQVKFARARTDRQLSRLWAALRGGNNVTVRYNDGSFAVQSLVGARATLPARTCG